MTKLISGVIGIAVFVAVASLSGQVAIEPLHFHHVHLNSVDPKAAAAYYPKPFALSATATTFNGFEAVKTGNIFILFTKVAATPQNELTGPQTSVWHFGWNTPNSRQYNEKFRAMGLTIAQMWDAADGKLVDMSKDLAAANQRLETIANQDALTGIANRRAFDHLINRELARAVRSREPLSVALCDVDHFKAFNDRYGHPAGDECLRSFSGAIKSASS